MYTDPECQQTAVFILKDLRGLSGEGNPETTGVYPGTHE